jgi:hypothetical protein
MSTCQGCGSDISVFKTQCNACIVRSSRPDPCPEGECIYGHDTDGVLHEKSRGEETRAFWHYSYCPNCGRKLT